MDIIYISFLEAEVPRINPCSLCNFSLNRPLQLVRGRVTNQDPTLCWTILEAMLSTCSGYGEISSYVGDMLGHLCRKHLEMWFVPSLKAQNTVKKVCIEHRQQKPLHITGAFPICYRIPYHPIVEWSKLDYQDHSHKTKLMMMMVMMMMTTMMMLMLMMMRMRMTVIILII